MDCKAVDKWLSEGRSPEELRRFPGFLDHLNKCFRCRLILDWLMAPVPDPHLRASLDNDVKALLRENLNRVRPLPGMAAMSAMILGAAAIVIAADALVLGTQGCVRLSFLQASGLGAVIVLAVTAAAVSLIASVSPGRPTRIPPAVSLGLLILGFPLAAALLFPFGAGLGLSAEGASCLPVGILLALVTIGAVWTVVRRGYSLDWRVSCTMIGATGGATALAALQTHCVRHEATHLIVWHGLAALIPLVAAFLWGRWMNSR